MKHLRQRTLCLFLLLLALVWGLAACTTEGDDPAETTAAVTTAVDTTVADTTAADTTVADTTAADTTAVDTTVAETTAPETTAAETTTPNYAELPYAPEAGELSIDGVDISAYCIVIPTACDLYTQYAALNLADYLEENADVLLNIITDDVAATPYELVIGATNRAGSARAAAVELEADEYIIMMDGTSVIFWGESYMVGGGAGAFIRTYAAGAWRGYDVNITDIPHDPTPEAFVFEEAENAILLIGDGMGENHIKMAEAQGLGHFSARDMATVGDIVTRSQSVILGLESATDSAAGGTALSTGYKTLNLSLGVDPNGDILQNVREVAHAAGANTAVLTTDTITGATPSAFLAHVKHRYENAADLEENLATLLGEGQVDFAEGDLNDDTFLARSTEVLQSMSAHGENFFIMVEEGYIDKNAHNNDAAGVVHTVERLDSLVAYCMEFVLFHPDTVVIVTADHETGSLAAVSGGKKFHFFSTDHSNVNVPLFAMGAGTDYFTGTHDNTRVPTFIASLYTEEAFGDPQYE